MSRGRWGFIQQEGFDALYIGHAASLDAMGEVLPLREGGQLRRQRAITEAASGDAVQLLHFGEDGRFAAILASNGAGAQDRAGVRRPLYARPNGNDERRLPDCRHRESECGRRLPAA